MSSWALGVLAFVSALWVLSDAGIKGARNPGGWALATALLWFVMLPVYLWRRRSFAEHYDATLPAGPLKKWVVIPLAAVIAFFPAVRELFM